ncbi:amidohydrolase family protein [Cohnella sp. CBP 2801]|uniref:Amidohydrolase family protein n=2 Tax=Cohnella zeiphila TaxID=2761120 RepID=A0A7X0SQK0_9BACL|nr:amidohydrolase family protein [Cohnella zeiphila]MBB6734308.1 amidohydrolase family protein [Cohnella zeiphila]
MEGGRIADVVPIADREDLPWLAPGLVDLQVNGFAGIDFNALPPETRSIGSAVRMLLRQGVTTFLPTVITNSDEAIEQLLASIASACAEDELVRACVAGIHLEGPFLSPADGSRGAHDRKHIRAPDWESFRRWQRAADGRILILTMSPEWENSARFISRCVSEGVIVSIGHTAATPGQIREAAAAGASMSTHLGNGAQLQLPRHPNYIWEQLAADELTACVIPDGFHLPDSVLKVFLRAKAGRIAFVSDAVSLSGLAPGAYRTPVGGDVVLTPEGRLHLASDPQLLAGSAQMLIDGIAGVVGRGLCTLAEAWELGSAAPAAAAGLTGVGRIEPGSAADLVRFRRLPDPRISDGGEARLTIEEVYKAGKLVFRREDELDQKTMAPSGSS